MLSAFTIAVMEPALVALAIPLLAFAVFGRRSPIARVVASATCVFCGLRYVWWRWNFSMPQDQAWWQQSWAWLFFAFEAATVLSSVAVYIFMSRSRDRSPVVDARPNSPMLHAPVDVFIATCNEEYDILERTIIGATSIEHPDLRVWVLDDGARPWVRELAASLGAEYRQRVRGAHAKAGNVNNGLRAALSTGRRPAFILLLDADFVAARTILRRTLPLFEEADVGIVQTPQHFFNPDPIQANLLCASVWPDEQRFFFNHLLASKDAWGAAFCCGTSAVFRVRALERCGGMPTATVTEDMLTSFCMREVGYRTVFLNEQLSLGLAPEGLSEYVGQRSRWCLGAIQQIRTRWGFAGRARIGLISRLSAFDGMLYWCASYAFKLLMISSPMLYWWTGTAVIDSTMDDMIVWLAPYLLSGMVFMAALARNTVFPVMTDVTHLLAAPVIVRSVVTGLVKPWGRAFKVTAKGVATNSVVVQWRLLAPFAFVGLVTLLGMLSSLSPDNPLRSTSGFALNVFWSIFNILTLSMACAVCVELPRRRRDERFASGEAASMMFAGRDPVPCRIIDISLGGARLRCAGAAGIDPFGQIMFDDDLCIRFASVRAGQRGDISIRFDHDERSRRSLTRKLFTGGYDNEIERVDMLATMTRVTRAVFG